MTGGGSGGKASIAMVLEIIVSVAPEIEDEITSLDGDADVFERFGLDSIDHLAVMTGIAERTGVEIPEREYGRLRSVSALAQRITG